MTAGIITLLFESPLLLFFLIAAILSFFQNKNKEQKKNQENRQPRQKEEEADEVDWRDIFRQEAPKPEAPEQKPAQSPAAQDDRRTTYQKEQQDPTVKMNEKWQERYQELDERKRKAAKSAAKLGDSPIETGDITAKKKPKIALDFSTVSRDEAVKGVIWAEILGKPKSMRKDRSIRR